MLDVAGTGRSQHAGSVGWRRTSAARAVVEASPSDDVTAEGPDAERALAVARRCRRRGLAGGARVRCSKRFGARRPRLGQPSSPRRHRRPGCAGRADARAAGARPAPPGAARVRRGPVDVRRRRLVVEGGVRPASSRRPRWPHAMPDDGAACSRSPRPSRDSRGRQRRSVRAAAPDSGRARSSRSSC